MAASARNRTLAACSWASSRARMRSSAWAHESARMPKNSSSAVSSSRFPGNDSVTTPSVCPTMFKGSATIERSPSVAFSRSGYFAWIASRPVSTSSSPDLTTSPAGVGRCLENVDQRSGAPSLPPRRPTRPIVSSSSTSDSDATVAPTASAAWLMTMSVTVCTSSALPRSAATRASRVSRSSSRRASRPGLFVLAVSSTMQTTPTMEPSRRSGEQLTSAGRNEPSTRRTSRRPAQRVPPWTWRRISPNASRSVSGSRLLARVTRVRSSPRNR